MKNKKKKKKQKKTNRKEKETHRKNKQVSIHIYKTNKLDMRQQRKAGQQKYTQEQVQQVI